jgi:hypothetical protein
VSPTSTVSRIKGFGDKLLKTAFGSGGVVPHEPAVIKITTNINPRAK